MVNNWVNKIIQKDEAATKIPKSGNADQIYEKCLRGGN
jgi:hypothetical protein